MLDETLTTPGGTVQVLFEVGEEDFQAFAGTNLVLEVAGFVTINGDFAFERSVDGANTKILVGAANVLVQMSTPDGLMGVRVLDAGFGLALYSVGLDPATFAVTAEGSAKIFGVDGLTLNGSLAVQVNNTGAAVN